MSSPLIFPRFLLCAALLAGTCQQALAQTRLRVFVGAQQRPEVMRQVFARYMTLHPGVIVEAETGGATSELQSLL